jgi:hypothetical protein
VSGKREEKKALTDHFFPLTAYCLPLTLSMSHAKEKQQQDDDPGHAEQP